MYQTVKSLCEKNRTNITELESTLGFPRGSIRKWDVNTPSVYKVKKVADHFGVTVDFIIK